jgi:transcriptional regulator with XRE-family HTH domain
MSTLGERIRTARENKGYLQNDLAKLIGVKSSGVISNWEKDLNKPDAEKIVKICEALNVSASFLLDYYGKSSFECSLVEQSLIKKYRLLDDIGRKHVTSVLDWELERTQTAQSQSDRIAELENNTCQRYFMTYYQKLASAGTGEYLFDDVPTDTIEVPCNELSAQADFVIGVNGDSMEPDYYDGEKVYVRKTDDLSVGKVGIFVQGSECFIKEKGTDCLISRNKDYPDIIPASDMQLIGEVIGKLE